jgi:hypothetical protein
MLQMPVYHALKPLRPGYLYTTHSVYSISKQLNKVFLRLYIQDVRGKGERV